MISVTRKRKEVNFKKVGFTSRNDFVGPPFIISSEIDLLPVSNLVPILLYLDTVSIRGTTNLIESKENQNSSSLEST